MFGCRTAIGASWLAMVLAGALGCGGSVEHGNGNSGAESGAGGGGSGAGAGGAGGSRAGSGGQVGVGGSVGGTPQGGRGGESEPEPVEGGCPMVEPPPPFFECDPLDPAVCGPGFGCYPFVEHPDGNGCEQQRYGTVCVPAGVGTQGSLCDGGPDAGCAPGFVCVVGQRAGKRCAQLCELGSPQACGGGLVCGELDVAGFGVCG